MAKMKHPHEKFIRIELLSIALALIIFIFSVIKGYLLFAIFSLLLIAVSLLSESMILLATHQKAQALKQGARAAIILLLAIYVLLKML